jgi:hypothetical protein
MVGDELQSDREPGRRWLVVVAVVAALLLGVWLFWPSSPEPVETVAEREAPTAAPPPVVSEPTPEPEPEVASEPAPRRAPRARPAPEPTPEPAPEPEAPTTGILRIESDVPGASIFLDRRFLGTAPVTAENLAPGSYQINASAEGYDGIAQKVEVAAGRDTLTIRFKEIRLDEAIDVVHKKAFGSVEGRLVASPDGIRFETKNPKDGFSATLAELQEFEVDYLKKNLKIKLRGGRTYNFTDRRDSADALFVFHRNVEKVRARVAAGPSEP